MLIAIAILCFIFAPLLIFLRSPKRNNIVDVQNEPERINDVENKVTLL